MSENKRTRIPREKAQEIILNAAEELFYQEGIHAVSVDAVVERAGIKQPSGKNGKIACPSIPAVPKNSSFNFLQI
jgi:hypothetical protein